MLYTLVNVIDKRITQKGKVQVKRRNFFRWKVAEENLEIESCGTDILQVFPELDTPEREKLHEEKPELHDAEYLRDCRPGSGNDLFAKNQNGGLEICWTLQRQV